MERNSGLDKEMPQSQFVKDKILEISRQTGLKVSVVKKEYERIFQDPFIQQDTGFKTDEMRQKWSLAALWLRFSEIRVKKKLRKATARR